MLMKFISWKGWNEFHYFDNEYKEEYMNDFQQNNLWLLYQYSIPGNSENCPIMKTRNKWLGMFENKMGFCEGKLACEEYRLQE